MSSLSIDSHAFNMQFVCACGASVAGQRVAKPAAFTFHKSWGKNAIPASARFGAHKLHMSHGLQPVASAAAAAAAFCQHSQLTWGTAIAGINTHSEWSPLPCLTVPWLPWPLPLPLAQLALPLPTLPALLLLADGVSC